MSLQCDAKGGEITCTSATKPAYQAFLREPDDIAGFFPVSDEHLFSQRILLYPMRTAMAIIPSMPVILMTNVIYDHMVPDPPEARGTIVSGIAGMRGFPELFGGPFPPACTGVNALCRVGRYVSF